jgi:hypothetical protein
VNPRRNVSRLCRDTFRSQCTTDTIQSAAVLFTRVAGFVIALLVIIGARSVSAQGTLTVLQTGGGQPLVSQQQVLQIGGITTPSISFVFGFSTDQTVSPGTFLDSFTVNLLDGNSDVAVVATVDASGTYWTPTTPGAVTLDPSQISFQGANPPTQSPIFGRGVAYSVVIPVPSSFTGNTVTADFDLFDNQDTTTSALGWFENVDVVGVPEPRTAVSAILGLALFAMKKRISR